MKNYAKTSASLLLASLLLAIPSAPVPAADSLIRVLVNGSSVSFDQPPVLENGRVLVPFRAIFEALNCAVSYEDAGKDKYVSATQGSTQLYTKIGSAELNVNDKIIALDTPSQIINNRVLVPVRAISESLDATVEWVAEKRQVQITTRQAGQHTIHAKSIDTTLKGKEGIPLIQVDGAYPVIQNPENNAYIQQINSRYQQEAESYLNNVKTEWLADAQEMYSGEHAQNPFSPLAFSLSYEINTDRGNILSITSYKYSFTGGAHPNSTQWSHIFDLKNQQELALSDILNGTPAEISETVAAAFQKYLDACQNDISAEGIASIGERIKEEIENVHFYVTDEALVLYFQPYQVGPYVLGCPTADIPFSGNENLFKLNLSDQQADALDIALSGNPTTGYTWELASPEPEIVHVSESSYVPAQTAEKLAGGGGTFHYTVTGKKPGNCTLRFHYLRKWEGAASAIKEITYHLAVDADGKITVLQMEEKE